MAVVVVEDKVRDGAMHARKGHEPSSPIEARQVTVLIPARRYARYYLKN